MSSFYVACMHHRELDEFLGCDRNKVAVDIICVIWQLSISVRRSSHIFASLSLARHSIHSRWCLEVIRIYHTSSYSANRNRLHAHQLMQSS